MTHSVSPVYSRRPSFQPGSPEAGMGALLTEVAPFVPAGTAQDVILARLFDAKVVDKNGRLLHQEALPELPPIPEKYVARIEEWLNYELLIKPREEGLANPSDPGSVVEEIRVPVRKILEHIGDAHAIYLIGGTVRKVLREWFLEVITEIPGCDPVHFDRFELKGAPTPMDFDLRVDMKGSSFDDLLKALYGSFDYVGSLFCKDFKKQPECAAFLKKYCLAELSETLFSDQLYTMASFEDKKEGRTVDLSFVSKLSRESLFNFDDMRLDLRPLLRGEKQLKLESSLPCKGWQAVLDNILNVNHVNSPETINPRGLPRLVRAQTLGARLPEDGVVAILLKTAMTKTRTRDIPLLFKKCYQNHVASKSSSVRSAYYLNLLTIISNGIHDQPELRSRLMQFCISELDCGDADGLFFAVATFLKANPDQYEVAEAWMQLAGLAMLTHHCSEVTLVRHQGFPALQWREDQGHWVMPLQPEKALDTLLAYKGDLGALGQCFKFDSMRRGIFYANRYYLGSEALGERALDGWNRSNPAVQRLCFALYMLAAHWDQPDQFGLVRSAAESQTPAELIEKVGESSEALVSVVFDRYPTLHGWNRLGSFFFRFFLERNPDRAASLFVNEYPHQNRTEQHSLFQDLFSVYNRGLSQNGELIAAGGLKLLQGVTKKKKKKGRQVPAVNLMPALSWICSTKKLLLDPAKRIALLVHALDRKLLPANSNKIANAAFECLRQGLDSDTCDPADVKAAWRKFGKGVWVRNSAYADLLLDMIEKTEPSDDIGAELKELELTGDQKKRARKLLPESLHWDALRTVTQKYLQRIAKMREGKNITALYRQAEELSSGRDEHRQELIRLFRGYCKTHPERALQIYQDTGCRSCMGMQEQLLFLNALKEGAHQTLRWQLIAALKDRHLDPEQISLITTVMGRESGGPGLSETITPLITDWIDGKLRSCSDEQIKSFLLEVSHLDLKGVSRCDTAKRVCGQDLDATHRIYSALHHAERRYSEADLAMLQRLISSEKNWNRRLLWIERLRANHLSEINPKLPGLAKQAFGDGEYALALKLLKMSPHEPNETLWKCLIVKFIGFDGLKAADLLNEVKESLSPDLLQAVLKLAVVDKALQVENLVRFLSVVSLNDPYLWREALLLIRSRWNSNCAGSFTLMVKRFMDAAESNPFVYPEMFLFCASKLNKDDVQYRRIVKAMTNDCRESGMFKALTLVAPLGLCQHLLELLLETDDAAVLMTTIRQLRPVSDSGLTAHENRNVVRAFQRASELSEEHFRSVEDNLKIWLNELFPIGRSASLQLAKCVFPVIARYPYGHLVHIATTHIREFAVKCPKIEQDFWEKQYIIFINRYILSPPSSSLDQYGEALFHQSLTERLVRGKRSPNRAIMRTASAIATMRREPITVPEFFQAFWDVAPSLDVLHGILKEKVLAACMYRLVRSGMCQGYLNEMQALVHQLVFKYSGDLGVASQPYKKILSIGSSIDTSNTFSLLHHTPGNYEQYFNFMVAYIKELCSVNTASMKEALPEFLIFYGGELIAAMLQRFGSGPLSTPDRKKQLADLLCDFVEMDIPQKEDIFQVYLNTVNELFSLSAFDAVFGSAARTPRLEVNTCLLMNPPNLFNSDFVKRNESCILKFFGRFGRSTNAEVLFFGLNRLRDMAQKGSFDTSPTLLAELLSAFCKSTAPYVFHVLTDPVNGRDTCFYEFLWSVVVTGPLTAKSQEDSEWRQAAGKVFLNYFFMVANAHTRLTVENTVMPLEAIEGAVLDEAREYRYRDSRNFFILHNLFLCRFPEYSTCINPLHYFMIVKSLFPALLEGLVKIHANQEFSDWLKQTSSLDASDNESINYFIDPVVLFNFQGQLSNAELESRRTVFDLWVKKVLGWQHAPLYLPRLKEAAIAYGIYSEEIEFDMKVATLKGLL